MDITRENTGELEATVKVHITEEDYLSKVNEVLIDFKKKARIDGFRPGKAPTGLIKKVYGKAALTEEVNKLLSEKLTDYLFKGDFQILGEPLPNENSPEIDWDNQKDFEFHFDIGLTPEIEVSLSKRDKIKWYQIEPEQSMIDDQVENYSKRFGQFETTDVAGKEDLVKGDLIELNEQGEKLDNGVEAFDALIGIDTLPNDAVKERFLGCKTGDEMVLDMQETFPNLADRASLLKVDKENLDGLSNSFRFTVGEVSRFTPVPVDKELFDKVYGENEVQTEEEFRARIADEMKQYLERESFYKFSIDVKEKLLAKSDLKLPDDFLKRWMLATSKDEKLTVESLENEYPTFSSDLKWQLIKDHIGQANELKVSQEETTQEAVMIARSQFQQYGIYDASDEHLVSFAKSILANEDEQRRINERILENKVINFVKEAVKLDEQTIGFEAFKKLFE